MERKLQRARELLEELVPDGGAAPPDTAPTAPDPRYDELIEILTDMGFDVSRFGKALLDAVRDSADRRERVGALLGWRADAIESVHPSDPAGAAREA